MSASQYQKSRKSTGGKDLGALAGLLNSGGFDQAMNSSLKKEKTNQSSSLANSARTASSSQNNSVSEQPGIPGMTGEGHFFLVNGLQHKYDELDAIFLRQEPNPNKFPRSNCTTCDASFAALGGTKAMQYCQFCGLPCCKTCQFKTKYFKEQWSNSNMSKEERYKQLKRGQCCKVCDRKFFIRDIFTQNFKMMEVQDKHQRKMLDAVKGMQTEADDEKERHKKYIQTQKENLKKLEPRKQELIDEKDKMDKEQADIINHNLAKENRKQKLELEIAQLQSDCEMAHQENNMKDDEIDSVLRQLEAEQAKSNQIQAEIQRVQEYLEVNKKEIEKQNKKIAEQKRKEEEELEKQNKKIAEQKRRDEEKAKKEAEKLKKEAEKANKKKKNTSFVGSPEPDTVGGVDMNSSLLQQPGNNDLSKTTKVIGNETLDLPAKSPNASTSPKGSILKKKSSQDTGSTYEQQRLAIETTGGSFLQSEDQQENNYDSLAVQASSKRSIMAKTSPRGNGGTGRVTFQEKPNVHEITQSNDSMEYPEEDFTSPAPIVVVEGTENEYFDDDNPANYRASVVPEESFDIRAHRLDFPEEGDYNASMYSSKKSKKSLRTEGILDNSFVSEYSSRDSSAVGSDDEMESVGGTLEEGKSTSKSRKKKHKKDKKNIAAKQTTCKTDACCILF